MAAGKNFLGSQNGQYRKNTPKYAGKEDGWRTMIGPHVMLGIGDQIRVRPDTEWSHKKARKTLEEEGNVPIPDHLDFDKENLVVTYNNVCDPSDFGISIEEKFVFMWYAGQG